MLENVKVPKLCKLSSFAVGGQTPFEIKIYRRYPRIPMTLKLQVKQFYLEDAWMTIGFLLTECNYAQKRTIANRDRYS